MNIKGLIKSAPLVNILYTKYKEEKIKEYYNEKGKILRSVGDEIIYKCFDTIYTKHRKEIWLDYGTLLGAIREKDYIKHDFDIDLSMFAEDFTDDIIISLEEVGFKMKRLFWRENLTNKTRKITEVTFTYKGLDVDIFFSYKNNKHKIVYSYIEKDIIESQLNRYAVLKEEYDFYGVESYTFRNIKVLIPQKANYYLSQVYGPNFMTPIIAYQPDINNDPHKEIEEYNKYRGIMIGVWDE